MNYHLIVYDLEVSSLDIISVDDNWKKKLEEMEDNDLIEEFLYSLGYNADTCFWSFTGNLSVRMHKLDKILKNHVI